MKEGSESTLWGRALLRDGVSRSDWGGAQADLERLLLTEGGRLQGPQGDAQGVQDEEAGEQSENEGSEGRDRTGGAWGHSSNRRRGTDLV